MTPDGRDGVLPERTVPSAREVFGAVLRSVATTAQLVRARALASPGERVGRELRDEGGSRSTVFRETTVPRRRPLEPVVLVVEFRLRGVRRARWAHAVFRGTCVVNTPLFAGFPGFVSKLWLTDPATGVYRGLYEWDGAQRAEWYAARLSRVLTLVSVRGSIAHTVLVGVARREFLDGLRRLPTMGPLVPGRPAAPGSPSSGPHSDT